MKLGFLAHTPLLTPKASSVNVMKMCHAWAETGHEVTLFCPRPARDGNPFSFYGVAPTFEIDWLRDHSTRIGRLVRQSRFAQVALWRRSIELVWARCHAIEPYKLDRLDRPFIVEAHTLHESDRFRAVLRNRNLRGLAVTNEELRREMRRVHDLGDLPVVVARSGADPVPDVRPRALPGNGRLRCGYVGNLYEGKATEILVPLAERCSRIDFHVFGGAPEDIEALKRKTTATNLFLHGFVPPSEVPAAMLGCDALLAPYQSRVHGASGKTNLARWMSPLKLVEYMAAGRAIVATDLPSIREIVRDGETALLCPPDDVDAWAAALGRLLAEPETRTRLGRSARDDFAKHHSWKARAVRLNEAFRLRR